MVLIVLLLLLFFLRRRQKRQRVSLRTLCPSVTLLGTDLPHEGLAAAAAAAAIDSRAEALRLDEALCSAERARPSSAQCYECPQVVISSSAAAQRQQVLDSDGGLYARGAGRSNCGLQAARGGLF